jgi:phospholipid/cholesterol/gamma-HCH transport system permease protein
MASRARTLVIHIRGDLVIATSRALHQRLRTLSRRGDLATVVLDLSHVGRLDSSGVAVLTLGARLFEQHGKKLDLRYVGDRHRAALDLMPRSQGEPEPLPEEPGLLERVGDRMLGARDRARQLGALAAELGREAAAVATRRRRLPEGAFVHQAVTLGSDALFIVGLLSFLVGMTMAFQGAVQLSKLGAQVYVADLIAMSMVRELAPLMTAIILSGRAGAAIAAELGTMRVGAELDALRTMGIPPVRFLVLPRLAALTVVVPALTLLSMFFGMIGGMVVASQAMNLPPDLFWHRTVEMLTLGDFLHGLSKSLGFAWIIGLTGSLFGLHATPSAGAVGTATTRTVVVCIFGIVVLDGAIATLTALGEVR